MRSGLTLAELTVAIVAMTVLAGGVTSAILLASRAMPSSTQATTLAIESMEIAHGVTGDIRYMREFIDGSPTELTFTVEDRTGDDLPETVTFRWTGQPGAPLVRQINDGPEVAVVENVHALQFDYRWQELTESEPNDAESPETVLWYSRSTKKRNPFQIDEDDWIALYFEPVLPAGATSWRISRVEIEMRRFDNDAGMGYVQIRTPESDLEPSDTVLTQTSFEELDLSNSWTWESFSFPSLPDQPVGGGLCVAVVHQVGDDFASVRRVHDKSVCEGNTGWVSKSDNGGASWWNDNDDSLQMFVFGHVNVPGGPTEVGRTVLAGVHIMLQVGSSEASRVYVGVETHNRPEKVD